jgi:hypothetical protein
VDSKYEGNPKSLINLPAIRHAAFLCGGLRSFHDTRRALDRSEGVSYVAVFRRSRCHLLQRADSHAQFLLGASLNLDPTSVFAILYLAVVG